MADLHKSKTVGNRIVGALKEFAEAVEAREDLQQRYTCRTVPLNLKLPTYSPQLVKKTRQLRGTSQAIFAQFLGVSASAVRDWEQGIKPPHGSACRLMDEIRRNPQYWVARLNELSTPVGAER